MAKITITIEDKEDGNVSVISDPSFEAMMQIHVSTDGLTAAHGYAFCALNAIREASKRPDGKIIVAVPRIGK